MIAAVALAALLGAAPQAPAPAHNGTFELQVSGFRPDIDAEFGGTGEYAKHFGTGRGWMFRASGAKTVWSGIGSVDVGLRVGYYQDSGHSLYGAGTPLAGQPSPDTETFNIIPTSAFVSYRFDWLVDRFDVPLAPYVRLAFDRYNWWTTSVGWSSRTGATNGWSTSYGLGLALDWLDPTLGREMQRDIGIEHVYAYVDLEQNHVSDFGSKKSWILSDEKRNTLGFGLLFAF